MCDVVAGQVIVYSNGRSWTSCQEGVARRSWTCRQVVVAMVEAWQWTSSSSYCRSWTSPAGVSAFGHSLYSLSAYLSSEWGTAFDFQTIGSLHIHSPPNCPAMKTLWIWSQDGSQLEFDSASFLGWSGNGDVLWWAKVYKLHCIRCWRGKGFSIFDILLQPASYNWDL